ncbi:hypothetical protein [Novosphingobium sp.]|uniref:hypothetical protein n=1 Tax=Novosphingobium sp. TaxID=1874826 RepID=UPI0035B32B75
MKRFTKRTRIVLGVVLVMALAVDVWWFTNRSADETQQFSLITTSTTFKFSDAGELPQYDPVTGKWILDGKPIGALESLVRHSDGRPDGIGKFIVVRVAEPASVDDVRKALNSLIDQGICQAGIWDQPSHDKTSEGEVIIFKIDWVLDDPGEKRLCHSDVN